MFNIDQKNLKNANLFAAGLALGTVGLKAVSYTHLDVYKRQVYIS